MLAQIAFGEINAKELISIVRLDPAASIAMLRVPSRSVVKVPMLALLTGKWPSDLTDDPDLVLIGGQRSMSAARAGMLASASGHENRCPGTNGRADVQTPAMSVHAPQLSKWNAIKPKFFSSNRKISCYWSSL